MKPGDKIRQFDRIAEVQSDKATVEITSRFDGTVAKLHAAVGEMAKVGKPLVDIDVPDGKAPAPPAAPAPQPEPVVEKPAAQRIFVPNSPSAAATATATRSR